MATENTNRESVEVLKLAGLGIAITTIINVVLFYVGAAIDAFDESVIVMDEELRPQHVVLSNVVFLILGTISYLAINKYTENSRTNFRNLAGVAYLLSLLNPIAIENIEALTYVFLGLMHTVSAVVFIYLLVYRD